LQSNIGKLITTRNIVDMMNWIGK